VNDNRSRVLTALRISSAPLDDDQLSDKAGVRPRQAVNQLCRAMETEGLLHRYSGPDGKIVNELRGVTEAPATPPLATSFEIEPAPVTARPPGSSTEQREAERVMLDLLGAQLGLVLGPLPIRLTSGQRIAVDGGDQAGTVIVECWAHQGPPKAAQRHKVLSDAFKLSWVGGMSYPRPRRILCFSDEAAAAPFRPESRSWAARALQDFDIEVVVVQLPDSVRQMILNAQRRQYR